MVATKAKTTRRVKCEVRNDFTLLKACKYWIALGIWEFSAFAIVSTARYARSHASLDAQLGVDWTIDGTHSELTVELYMELRGVQGHQVSD